MQTCEEAEKYKQIWPKLEEFQIKRSFKQTVIIYN